MIASWYPVPALSVQGFRRRAAGEFIAAEPAEPAESPGPARAGRAGPAGRAGRGTNAGL